MNQVIMILTFEILIINRDPGYFCNLQNNIKSKNYSKFHHNVCSLTKKFDQVYALLRELKKEFNFILITQLRISELRFSQKLYSTRKL